MRIRSDVAGGMRILLVKRAAITNPCSFLPSLSNAHVHVFLRAIFLIPKLVVVNMALPVSFRQYVNVKYFRNRHYPQCNIQWACKCNSTDLFICE
jgi:hypothetical protein